MKTEVDVIPRYGHMLTKEKPVAVAQVVLNWLNQRCGLVVVTNGNCMDRNTPAKIDACAT